MLRPVQQRTYKTASQNHQDVINFEPELVPCYPQGQFDWREYMAACGTQPVTSESMFGHVRFVKQRIAEVVFKPGQAVYVKNANGRPRIAVVEVCVEVQLHVTYVDNGQKGIVSVQDIVTDGELQEQENTVVDGKRELTFVEYTEDLKNIVMKRIYEVIEPDQYFEIQDDAEPRSVTVAKVVANHNGNVIYSVVNGNKKQVHITCERCHFMGWVERKEQAGVAYHRDDMCILEAAQKNPVPAVVFESRKVRKHNVKKGHMVEVVDSFHPSVIFPGFVSSILNEYYFRVSISTEIANNDYELVAHGSYPYVFPPGFCRANGLRLAVPQGYAAIGSGAPNEFTWSMYKENMELLAPMPEDGVVHPVVMSPPEPMHHLEVFYYSKNMILTAVVTRVLRHMLWFSADSLSTLTPAQISHVDSTHLFPVGSKCGTQTMLFPPVFNTLPPLKEGETRFGKDKIFTSIPTAIFTQSRKPYIPENYIKEDTWLPRVYVNSSCFCGPFIDSARMSTSMKSSYGPGEMHDIIRSIMKDLLGSVFAENDLFRLYEWADRTSLPTIFSKKDRRKFRKTDLCKVLRVPRCEYARTFAGWMRMFLRVLDACPMLISLEKVRGQGPCSMLCNRMKESSFSQPTSHIATSSVASTSTAPVTVPVSVNPFHRRLNLLSASGPIPPGMLQVVPPVTRAQASEKKEKEPGASKKEATGTKRRSGGKTTAPEAKTNGAPNNKKKRVSREQRPVSSNENSNSGVPVEFYADSANDSNSAPVPSPISVEHINSTTRVPCITVSDDEVEDLASPVKIIMRSPVAQSTPGGSSPEQNDLDSSDSFTQDKEKKVAEEENGENVVENSPQLLLPSDPYTWACSDLIQWLRTRDNFDEMADYLEQQDIDGPRFLTLTLNECLEMGIRLGPALKLVEIIQEVKQAHGEQFL